MKKNLINSARVRKIKGSLKTDMKNGGIDDRIQSLVTLLVMNWSGELLGTGWVEGGSARCAEEGRIEPPDHTGPLEVEILWASV